MNYDDLRASLEEAEHIAEQHDQVAKNMDNQTHEDFQYAALQLLECEGAFLPEGWMP